MRRGPKQTDYAVRLARHYTDGPNGCMNWTGVRNRAGYGMIQIGGRLESRLVLAHRLSAHAWKGFDLDSGFCVLHRCDNPSCINPDHLFIGTQADNMADREAKGRGADHAGTNNGKCRLTEPQVLEIRKSHGTGITQTSLAYRYGVSVPAINHIITRRNWAHVA